MSSIFSFPKMAAVCSLFALTGAGCDRSPETACADLAVAECAHRERCAPALLVDTGDLDTCRRDAAVRCEGLLDLDGAALTIADLDACAAAYDDTPCESLLFGAPPPECRFHGTRPNGAACTAGAECQSSRCEHDLHGECGQCASQREIAALCSKGGSPCAPGLYCGPSGRCVPFGSAGEPCSPAEPCNPLFWCDDGACAAPVGLGEPCPGDTTCDLLAGLVCDPVARVCWAGEPSALASVLAPPLCN
ncbi:MAG: hypothetical protein R3B70_01180 [Polyangiaceae bacterium]